MNIQNIIEKQARLEKLVTERGISPAEVMEIMAEMEMAANYAAHVSVFVDWGNKEMDDVREAISEIIRDTAKGAVEQRYADTIRENLTEAAAASASHLLEAAEYVKKQEENEEKSDAV